MSNQPNTETTKMFVALFCAPEDMKYRDLEQVETVLGNSEQECKDKILEVLNDVHGDETPWKWEDVVSEMAVDIRELPV